MVISFFQHVLFNSYDLSEFIIEQTCFKTLVLILKIQIRSQITINLSFLMNARKHCYTFIFYSQLFALLIVIIIENQKGKYTYNPVLTVIIFYFSKCVVNPVDWILSLYQCNKDPNCIYATTANGMVIIMIVNLEKVNIYTFVYILLLYSVLV